MKISLVVSSANASKNEIKNFVNNILKIKCKYILELIFIDDQNACNVNLFLKKINNMKVKIIKNSKNMGLTKSLIKGIASSSGNLIARQDIGDFSIPNRFEIQANEFIKNKSLVLLGSNFKVKNKVNQVKYIQVPKTHKKITRSFYFKNPFCHSSVMFLKKSYYQVGGYNSQISTAQDLDLWIKMSKVGQTKNINKFLVTRVLDEKSISLSSKKWNQALNSFLIRLHYLQKEKKYIQIFPIFFAFVWHILHNVKNEIKK